MPVPEPFLSVVIEAFSIRALTTLSTTLFASAPAPDKDSEKVPETATAADAAQASVLAVASSVAITSTAPLVATLTSSKSAR